MDSMRGGVSAVVVAILVLSAGCSAGSSGASDDEQKGLVGVELTYPTATAFALVENGYAAVDGLSPSSDGRRLRVWITESGSRKSFEGPKGSAMSGISAWVRGDEILVMGSLCPKWDREVANQFEDGSLEPLCGVEETALYGLQWRKGTWRTVSTSLPGLGPKKIMSRPGVKGDVLVRGGDSGALLNTDSGRWRMLSGLPLGVGESCQGPDGVVSVGLEGGDNSPPDQVAPDGISEPSNDMVPAVHVYHLDGDLWRDGGTYPQSNIGGKISTVGCLDGAVVLRADKDDKNTALVTVRWGENQPIFESKAIPSTEGDSLRIIADDSGSSAVVSIQTIDASGVPQASTGFLLSSDKQLKPFLNATIHHVWRLVIVKDALIYIENERRGKLVIKSSDD